MRSLDFVGSSVVKIDKETFLRIVTRMSNFKITLSCSKRVGRVASVISFQKFS